MAISHGGRVGSFVGGGASGGISLLTGNLFLSSSLSGAAGGGAYSASQQLIDDGDINWEEFASDVVISGFLSSINIRDKKLTKGQRTAMKNWMNDSLKPNQKARLIQALSKLAHPDKVSYIVGGVGEGLDQVYEPSGQ